MTPLSLLKLCSAWMCLNVANGMIPGFRNKCELLDMTYTLKEGVITWPSKYTMEKGYKRENVEMQPPIEGFDPMYVKSGAFSMAEHVGTHIDAPKHIVRNRALAETLQTIDQVPLVNLVGEACVVDIPDKQNKDYMVTSQDLVNWEKSNGRFHEDCVVILRLLILLALCYLYFRTGTSRFWGDRANYLGYGADGDVKTDNSGSPVNLHYPGLSPEAAQWLVDNRDLVAYGVDTISIDAGQQRDRRNSVHTIILGASKPGFENLANVDKLPARGATIFAMPLKLNDASGSPARVMAIGWTGESDPCRINANGAQLLQASAVAVTLFSVLMAFIFTV